MERTSNTPTKQHHFSYPFIVIDAVIIILDVDWKNEYHTVAHIKIFNSDW